VHQGVVLVEVALAASGSYVREAEEGLEVGESAVVAGHEVRYLGLETVEEPNRTVTKARVEVDGGRVYEPRLSRFPNFGSPIPTPSVRTGFVEDVFLSITQLPEDPDGALTLRVIVQPLTVWLWIGGGVMALGTVLSAWPGRRRRPTDPASALPAAGGTAPPDDGADLAPPIPAEPRPEPVGVD
ncbi:MAG: cytochrome c-type biogenesis CcmF C-terminal domain-containing protein, partial [Acidimicrobiia bacterium]